MCFKDYFCFARRFVSHHHEMSHARADERLNRKKWPWQREGAAEPGDDGDEQHYSNKQLYHKFR